MFCCNSNMSYFTVSLGGNAYLNLNVYTPTQSIGASEMTPFSVISTKHSAWRKILQERIFTQALRDESKYHGRYA